MLLLVQLVIVGLCAWLVLSGWLNVVDQRAERRRDARLPPLPEDAPFISVCIPARNEEHNVGPLLESLARQAYPCYEVLLLDDCSEDRTAEIALAIAARYPHLRVLQGRPLESGWIGKPHACRQLAAAARGDWLLFTDADTEFARGTLTMAMRRARARHSDLLSGLPRLVAVTIWERLSVPLLQTMALGGIPFRWMERLNHRRAAAASGAFILIRRAAYDAVGGHEAVRGEIVDDLNLARAVKRAGFRTHLTDVTRHVRCRMYRSRAEVWEGFSKNFHAVFPGYQTLLAIAYLTGVFILPPVCFILSPWLGLSPWSGTILPAIQIAAVGLHRALVEVHAGEGKWGTLLLTPLSAAFTIAIALRSLSRRLLRQPTPWRNRHYELWRN
ncbi:MAG TPA: glycosyltransferase family 2 protein [Candidatus Sumerlaeota bacterium]|nr:glycosyltransferase family 2 protein [Candidatus Sumerlaeota bacterium]